MINNSVKPHVVIDARLYGPKHTGLGRYTKNLLIALTHTPGFEKYRFTLIIYPNLESEIKSDLGKNYRYYVTKIKHYSIAEQLFLPSIIDSLHPNLVHFCHLDKPILYSGKSIVTVHDLIRHFSRGRNTTTKSPLLYWPKYIGYLLMTHFIIKNSSIIVPSNFWRNYIIKKFNFNQQNIITTYEAVDPNIKTNNKTISTPLDYIVYTGNLYPHKNVSVILRALISLPKVKLKIICARDIFAKRLSDLAKKIGVEKQVEFLGYVQDNEFSKLYQSAIALVHPAFLEGFSLTGLEAMALNCPVIASNSSCLPEIYNHSVLYFDPDNEQQLINNIKDLQNSKILRMKMIKLGQQQIKKFSWGDTARKTLAFYEKLL